MLDRRRAISVGLGGLALAIPGIAAGQENGQFSGNPMLEGLGSGKMKLLREFRYRDPRGTLWRVPRDYVSDGASIPRVLWSVAGSPWTGNYTEAAIVHDFYCDGMHRSWETTHQVFYDAMRSRGVSKSEATKKYWAVYNFGPRWDATHRWTSLLQLDKKPRRGSSLLGGIMQGVLPTMSMPDGSRATDWSRSWSTGEDLDAPAAQTEDFLALQEREFARASAVIEMENLGPENVPDLQPELSE